MPWEDEPLDENYDVDETKPVFRSPTRSVSGDTKADPTVTDQVFTDHVVPPSVTGPKPGTINIAALLNPADATPSQLIKACPVIDVPGAKTSTPEQVAAWEHNTPLAMYQRVNRGFFRTNLPAPPLHAVPAELANLPSYTPDSAMSSMKPAHPEREDAEEGPDHSLPAKPASASPLNRDQPTSSAEPGTIELLAPSALLEAGFRFLNSPPSEKVVSAGGRLDEDCMMSAAAFQQHKIAAARAGLKRKAADISRTDESTEPVDVSAEAADKAPEPVEPPTKRAKMSTATRRAWAIAESVTLAALGGMVVLGSMIYTAPALT